MGQGEVAVQTSVLILQNLIFVQKSSGTAVHSTAAGVIADLAEHISEAGCMF